MAIDALKLNQKLCSDTAAYILESDNDYYNQLLEVAEKITLQSEEKPIILLSGPSGSGKTTTALTLEHILTDSGVNTKTLSLDNYFLPLSLEDKDKLAAGKLDLESPKRVDATLLNEQIEALIACEEVLLPKYDFKHGGRKPVGKRFKREPEQLIIFEGIHALNPDVITIPCEQTSKIYVSVRTRVCDSVVTLHPSKIRLLRRMIRDRLFRNRTLLDTISMYTSVQAGEEKYIMPHKVRSDYDIDTFIAYEMSVYKSILISELKELKQISDVPAIADLIEILDVTDELNEEYVPKTSLIREFIGNGHLKY